MAAPLRETIRQQRLQLSILNEQIGNGDQVNASANITAIITALQTMQTAINAATSATLTTIS